jgi:predicted nucleic acid-binding protein
MTVLLDTNVLVYRFDGRDLSKQAIATELIRQAIAERTARLAHQSLVEFVAATTRRLPGDGETSLLTPEEAIWECEELIRQVPILYPCEAQVRIALRGWRTYGLSWFDAHIWSFAEYYGFDTLYSEDFQHDRTYGLVRVVNPFA